MIRIISMVVLSAAVTVVPAMAQSSAANDLAKVQTAFSQAKSWHADEHFSNGKTVTVDFSAPDRWRIQPTAGVTELLIGNDMYMVRNGHATHLPFGGAMAQKIIGNFRLMPENDEIRQSARDLGTQTLNGKTVHVYSYTSRGTPVTLSVGPDSLPVQSVVQSKRGTTTIVYSNYNVPVSIEP